MSRRALFLDTGIFIAWVNPRDRHHHRAHELVRTIKEGQWAKVETNDHVVAEALDWLRANVRDPAAAHLVLRLVFGTKDAEGLIGSIHRTDAAAYDRALADYFRYADRGLSFTDCTVLASMAELRVSTLASFDNGFRGLVAEMVPEVPSDRTSK